MVTSTQLIFLLFFVSIANAAYSSLAHWITTSTYFENKMFKDLSTNNNDPIKNGMGGSNGAITDGTITCANWLTPIMGSYYGTVQSLSSATTTEYGVSVWVHVPTPFTSVGNILDVSTSTNSPSCKIYSQYMGVTGKFATSSADIDGPTFPFGIFYHR